MVYDPAERLFYSQAEATLFRYDGGAMLAEQDSNTGAVRRRYVPGPGTDEPVVWYEGSGTSDKRWLVADERGSVVAVTNASGNAINIKSYDEFGIPYDSTPANAGRFGYTGQAWLSGLGMSYYKARMYSPTLGRFLQTDPIGYADGVNWYNYVGSDPVNGVDPDGTHCEGGTAPESAGRTECERAGGKFSEVTVVARDSDDIGLTGNQGSVHGGTAATAPGRGGGGSGGTAPPTNPPVVPATPKKEVPKKPSIPKVILCGNLANKVGSQLAGAAAGAAFSRGVGAAVTAYKISRPVLGAEIGAQIGAFGGPVGIIGGLAVGLAVDYAIDYAQQKYCEK